MNFVAKCIAAAVVGSAFLGSLPAVAAEDFVIVIRNHKFEPAELEVPAGKKVRLIVRNEDATAEEFESYDLNREKMVGPGREIKVFVGPLKEGRYEFFGEFNPETARGWLIVR